MTEFEQKCFDGYAIHPYFSDASHLDEMIKLRGLWWSSAKQLIIPDAFDLRQLILCEMHDSPYRGHVGVKKTKMAMELLCSWPTLAADVEAYVTHCPSCQRMKPTNQKPAGPVSMDLITALLETKSGNTAIVVFVDRFTEMTHLAACQTHGLKTLQSCLDMKSLGCMDYPMS